MDSTRTGKRLLLDLHHRLVRLPRATRVAQALSELARPARTLLDVGAGDGRVGAALAELLDARVEGVDVLVQPGSLVPVLPYDGRSLPFPDASYDVVALADVLHHAEDAGTLLAEALRVAGRCVVVKDHFAFGALSARWLRVLDRIGNAQQGIPTRDAYLTPRAWLELVHRVGGVVTKQIWPLDVHSAPIRTLTRSELQFAARVERRVG